jgi:putative isomerase
MAMQGRQHPRPIFFIFSNQHLKGASYMDKQDESAVKIPHMKRRTFLRHACETAIACALPPAFAFAQKTSTEQEIGLTTFSRTQLSGLLDTLLETDSPELHSFAIDVYATCVLGKIRKPDPPLKQAWIVPGGGYFAQWLWDTMFVADLLSLLPGQEEIIRGVFQNYWDFQQRWNAAKPEFMHGMVANFIKPYDAPERDNGTVWQTFPAYSQAPLLAWGMERVYLKNQDKELLRTGLKPLENFHEWYWRERDLMDLGLIGVGSYSGVTQHARFETYDLEVDLDGLTMIPHPGRITGPDNGQWYGNIAIPANTAYLLLSELSLERMAVLLGDHDMAARRRSRYEKGAASMRELMWDQGAGCFLAVDIKSLEKINAATVGGFMPLMAHVPTKKQAEAMAAALSTPTWATPLPIPTVARTDPHFLSGKFWRGDVWPAPDYQVATGLALYGHHDVAARIADATLANALKVGTSERYDSVLKIPLGVRGLGMSATNLTMALDGLTSSAYSIRIRNRPFTAALH